MEARHTIHECYGYFYATEAEIRAMPRGEYRARFANRENAAVTPFRTRGAVRASDVTGTGPGNGSDLDPKKPDRSELSRENQVLRS